MDTDVAMSNNKKVPYLWMTKLASINPQGFMYPPVTMQNQTIAMTVKACLAYLLLFYPEFFGLHMVGI